MQADDVQSSWRCCFVVWKISVTRLQGPAPVAAYLASPMFPMLPSWHRFYTGAEV